MQASQREWDIFFNFLNLSSQQTFSLHLILETVTQTDDYYRKLHTKMEGKNKVHNVSPIMHLSATLQFLEIIFSTQASHRCSSRIFPLFNANCIVTYAFRIPTVTSYFRTFFFKSWFKPIFITEKGNVKNDSLNIYFIEEFSTHLLFLC